MDTSLLGPGAAMGTTAQKSAAIKAAKDQENALREKARRGKIDLPPYEFDELIGKGAYGRVYKGRHAATKDVVAIKVMEVDQLDYEMPGEQKDESIADFIRETKILRQVKDSGAKNVNMIIDSFPVYSQLWLIAEYCPGGSVKTLMRATGDKLEERFIIPVARELAEGLRAIHKAGIIHRDVKAANVLIHEEGRLQICDFGVAGILQSKVDKRTTWIGTLHWMPPEMFAPTSRGDEPYKYGSEIDIWAYGCTLFEFATGNPPNANLRDRMHVARRIRQGAPTLKGDNLSEELQQLVQFVLNPNPITRPTMKDVVAHPYFADTSETYPISSLKELVENYYQWSQKGGQRVSLFNPGGAQAAEYPEDEETDEDWEFSATPSFERRQSKMMASAEGELTPTKSSATSTEVALGIPGAERTPQQQANFDDRVHRGAVAMEGLFDQNKPDYVYEQKSDWLPIEERQQKRISDLPLRTDTDRSRVASTSIEIDLGDFNAAHYLADTAANFPTIQLADPETIRANRSNSRLFRDSSLDLVPKTEGQDEYEYASKGPRPPTMDWKFPSEPKRETRDWKFPSAPMPEEEAQFNEPKRATMDWKFPSEEKRATRDWKFPGLSTEEAVIKRATKDWTFPAMAEEEAGEEESSFGVDLTMPELTPSSLVPNRQLERAYTDPISGVPYDQSLAEEVEDHPERPSTALSTTSVDTDVETDYDPFKLDVLEDQDHRHQDPEASQLQHGLRRMLSGPDVDSWTRAYSASGLPEDSYNTNIDSGASYQEGLTATRSTRSDSITTTLSSATSVAAKPLQQQQIRSQSGTNRGLSSTARSSTTLRRGQILFPEVVPPSMEAMREGASEEVVLEELDRLVGGWTDALGALGGGLRDLDGYYEEVEDEESQDE